MFYPHFLFIIFINVCLGWQTYLLKLPLQFKHQWLFLPKALALKVFFKIVPPHIFFTQYNPYTEMLLVPGMRFAALKIKRFQSNPSRKNREDGSESIKICIIKVEWPSKKSLIRDICQKPTIYRSNEIDLYENINIEPTCSWL